ncbi:MAG: DNA gyrase inhibitor YacG [Acidobacteria bacterium]|nr:DNA gyrase inhibitor YacG [Acidobacteriota bacterium]
MKCPICKKPLAFGDPYMPFCGERCKLIDLGNWAAEKYVISTPVQPDQLDEEAEDERSA